jgi:Uma2 family endonuclease
MNPKPAQLSPAQYLEWEMKSSVKHEYVDGEVYAMSGASRRHNLIVGNLLRRALNAAAEHGGCQVFGSGMRVQVEARNSYYYPDVSACCDRNDRDELYVTSPCFIIEVLSPSTASIDRREKRASYATLTSLLEYIIVDQDRMRVELYRRESHGWGGYILNQPDDFVELSCSGLRLTLSQIYEGIELPPGISEPELPEYAVAFDRALMEPESPPN